MNNKKLFDTLYKDFLSPENLANISSDKTYEEMTLMLDSYEENKELYYILKTKTSEQKK